MNSSYQDLQVWQRSIQFVKQIYLLIRQFPKEEFFGICDQLRRASVSIPANIAEGKARYSNKDFVRFIRIAKGSVSEVETLIILSFELGYINTSQRNEYIADIQSIGKMLHGLLKSLE